MLDGVTVAWCHIDKWQLENVEDCPCMSLVHLRLVDKYVKVTSAIVPVLMALTIGNSHHYFVAFLTEQQLLKNWICMNRSKSMVISFETKREKKFRPILATEPTIWWLHFTSLLVTDELGTTPNHKCCNHKCCYPLVTF